MTWLEQTSPSTYRVPLAVRQANVLTDGELDKIRASGFDFVRLTVDPSLFVVLHGAQRDAALNKLTGVVDRFMSRNLAVLVDMHPVKAVYPFGQAAGGGSHPYQYGADNSFTKRYADAIGWLAGKLDARYADARSVAFELMNEPDLACVDRRWAAELELLHHTVRKSARHMTIVLNGACWDNVDGLINLGDQSGKDENTLYTFHFYDPHDFTHAGIITLGSKDIEELALSSLGGLPYPVDGRDHDQALQAIRTRAANHGREVENLATAKARQYLAQKWDRSRIEGLMNRVRDWAARSGIAPSRILLGEFGVNGQGNGIEGQAPADRLRWLTDVRSAADAHQFRWAFWQYRGNGLTDYWDLERFRGGGVDDSTLNALGLRARRGQTAHEINRTIHDGR
jgi:aryl-phospho-beta-D-glucosidase BglC (GH1 family)